MVKLVNTFTIVQELDPQGLKPFIIIECFPTCNGFRARITDYRFGTLGEALAVVNHLRDEARMEVDRMEARVQMQAD